MSNGFTKHNKNRDKNNEFVLHKSKLDSVPAENKKNTCAELKKNCSRSWTSSAAVFSESWYCFFQKLQQLFQETKSINEILRINTCLTRD